MKCSNGNLATCWIYISQLRTRIPVPVHNSERLRSLHAYEKKNKNLHENSLSSVEGVLRVKLKLIAEYLREV